VDFLEERYPDFDGLNLTFETREGILKHCSQRHAERLEASEPGGVGRRFIDRTQPSLEAQLCNLADEIAYNAHDVDDGVRSGLIRIEQLEDVPLFFRFQREALAEHPGLAGRRLLFDAIRRMLSAQVYDVLDATCASLDKAQPNHVSDVRASPVLVCFSEAMARESLELKRFLRVNLYRHPQVTSTTDRAKEVVRDLFAVYRFKPEEWAKEGDATNLRKLADYIAGMTDRFAVREHERLTGRRLFD
jgi:dGTPase